MRRLEGLKSLKITKPLMLLIISEIIIIELIAFLPFGTMHEGGAEHSIEGGEPSFEEYIIIVFKKDYFLGKAKVRIKPYENSVAILLFPSGETLNITGEYVFLKTLLLELPSRLPFEEGFIFEYDYSNPLFYEEPSNPYYTFVGSRKELKMFIPPKVWETMRPFYLATVRGKISEIELEVYGVTPWNRN